jgi:hypothetical protein
MFYGKVLNQSSVASGRTGPGHMEVYWLGTYFRTDFLGRIRIFTRLTGTEGSAHSKESIGHPDHAIRLIGTGAQGQRPSSEQAEIKNFNQLSSFN